ncbi:MAG: hypothetical protein PVF50_11230, partial [Gammaproteobacteria bacterium]
LTRLELAGAILQGISPDPELFVNRLELLCAYSMIEHVFVATDPRGRVDYTPLGRRHIEQFQDYEALLSRLVKSLHDDCSHFRPADGAYSPFGATFGTPSNLIENMALKTLSGDAMTAFTLEDVFTDGDSHKVAWVNGWRKLPHIRRDVQRLLRYPGQYAREIFERIEYELNRRVCGDEVNETPRAGRMLIGPAERLQSDSEISPIRDLPVRHVRSSDAHIVAARRGMRSDQAQLLHDRTEGHFVVSYGASGGWVAISKDILTEVIGSGHDVRIVELPAAAAQTLKLTCPGLVDTHGRKGR